MTSMKTVILEVSGNYAAALSEDGTISRIPNHDYQVGQTLMLPKPKQISRFTVYARRIAAVAAVFVLMLAGGSLLMKTPVTYVSLDVNPSVEYKLNLFDQVVEVVSVNEDAEKLLENTELAYQPAEEAIRHTVQLLGESNYLKPEERNNILVSASGSVTSKAKSVLNTVTKATWEAADSMDVSADIIAIESSLSDVKEAEKLGTTAGKLLLVNEVVETAAATMSVKSDSNPNMEDLLQKPVAEIVSAISEEGLTHISEKNESIRYIPANKSSEISEASQIEESAEKRQPSSEAVESKSDTAASGVSDHNTETASQTESASIGSESTESAESSSGDPSDEMDSSEIPNVNPGPDSSSTVDTDTTSAPENSLDITIPDVEPGIGAEDTEDTESKIETENSLDEVTSAPEQTEAPESSTTEDSEYENSSEDVSSDSLSEQTLS